jgi:hypothetical protein
MPSSGARLCIALFTVRVPGEGAARFVGSASIALFDVKAESLFFNSLVSIDAQRGRLERCAVGRVAISLRLGGQHGEESEQEEVEVEIRGEEDGAEDLEAEVIEVKRRVDTSAAEAWPARLKVGAVARAASAKRPRRIAPTQTSSTEGVSETGAHPSRRSREVQERCRAAS